MVDDRLVACIRISSAFNLPRNRDQAYFNRCYSVLSIILQLGFRRLANLTRMDMDSPWDGTFYDVPDV